MYKIHTKIGDFEFIESEFETLEQAQEAHYNITEAFKPKDGLTHLAWNALLEKYTNTAQMEQHEYDSLNEKQKFVIQELKKLYKRQKALTDKE